LSWCYNSDSPYQSFTTDRLVVVENQLNSGLLFVNPCFTDSHCLEQTT
jgi:hypothetical protein